MAKGRKKATHPEWGVRVRNHIKAGDRTMIQIANLMGLSEPGLRALLNGTNKINLEDFERLCAIIDADKCVMLMGRPALTPKQWDALRSVVVPRSSS